MSAWAKPGVKCVCVGDLAHLSVAFGILTPAVGQTYTIRRVELRLGPHGGIGLLLDEVVNSEMPLTNGSVDEPAFDVCDFRPLITIESDVAQFQHHLNTVEEPA